MGARWRLGREKLRDGGGISVVLREYGSDMGRSEGGWGELVTLEVLNTGQLSK